MSALLFVLGSIDMISTRNRKHRTNVIMESGSRGRNKFLESLRKMCVKGLGLDPESGAEVDHSHHTGKKTREVNHAVGHQKDLRNNRR